MKNTKVSRNNIKKLREERDWSSRMLAQKIGTSPAHMGRLEKGRSPLTKDWILKLAAVFDMNSDKIADIPVSKEIAVDCDDALLGSTIGWLQEAADKNKIKLSAQELSKWTSYIYKEAITRPLNYQLTRYLTFTIVKVMKETRKG